MLNSAQWSSSATYKVSGGDDLRRAGELQRRFLPSFPTVVRGVRVAAAYRPAFDVGGDFYDFVQTDSDRFITVIGDVSGKGVAAALVMARVMVELHDAARRGLAPEAILADVNAFLIESELGSCFVTAACLEVDLRHRIVAVANAGHVPPLMRRRLNDRVSVCGRASGAPLGTVAGETYRRDLFRFEGDDIVLLVTDGVTEAIDRGSDPDLLVLSRVVATSAHHVDALASRVLHAVRASTLRRRADDVALFALQLP